MIQERGCAIIVGHDIRVVRLPWPRVRARCPPDPLGTAIRAAGRCSQRQRRMRIGSDALRRALLHHLRHAAARDPRQPAAVGADLVSPVLPCHVAGDARHGRRRDPRFPRRRRARRATPRCIACPALALAFARARWPPRTWSRCASRCPVQPATSVVGLASLATAIAALTVPFYFSGMVVTIALTRTRCRDRPALRVGSGRRGLRLSGGRARCSIPAGST